MTLYQYNQLDELEQIDSLCKDAVFLDFRIEAPFKYALYQIQSFYIELKYHTVDNNLQGLRTFTSTCQLEPYLDKIEIII